MIQIKSKIKKSTTIRLEFDLEEFKVLYDKLVIYTRFDPLHYQAETDSGEKYMTKSPTDEVEEFLINMLETLWCC